MALRPYRVLLVEDNPGDARLVVELLRESGEDFDVETVMRLGEAQARAGQDGIDVVLLDLSLPDAHGLETVERFLETAPALPVIVLTGLVDQELAVRAVQAGAQDYLTKGTFDGELLARSIRYARERKRREQAERFLAEVGVRLSASLELEATVESVARVAVPALADWCIIDLIDEAGELRTLEAAAASAEKEARLREMLQRYPHGDAADAHPVAEALRTGEAMLLPDVGERMERAARDPAHLEMLRELAPRSSMVVPLKARGHAVGVIVLTAAESGRRYDRADLALARELAQRAGLAIENARLYRQAQEAVAARNHTLAVVAHDLRNPLHAVGLIADALERLVPTEGKAGGQARQFIGQISRATDEMDALIEDLLDVARVESGRLELDRVLCPIDRIVEPVVETHEPLAAEKGLTLAVEAAGPVPPVRADVRRLRRVLQNLIGNAIKFTRPGGTVTLRVAAEGDEVCFEVSDTGLGIEPEGLEHVFDRFWQARHARRAGAGLGLAIAKAIVDAHGGWITAESELGVGTTFRFALPAARPPAAARDPEEEACGA